MDIEYELEDSLVEEAVFIINGASTADELLDLIRSSGLKFTDSIDRELKFVNENGQNKLVIYRHEQVKVPYKVEKSLVTSLPVMSSNMDNQRKRADILRLFLENEEEDNTKYEIVEEKDSLGQVVSYQIYEVKREKLEDEKALAIVNNNEEKGLAVVDRMGDRAFVELKQGPYFQHGDRFYVEFHYKDLEQKQRIFKLFDEGLIPSYGSLSSRSNDGRDYIMPYLVDGEGNFTTENTGIIGGCSIPNDLLEPFLRRFVEFDGFDLKVGDQVMSRDFDLSRFQDMLSIIEKHETIEERRVEYVKQLLNYTRDRGISVNDYYLELARGYQSDGYVPPSFELNNPFLSSEDYDLLRKNNNEQFAVFFARSMENTINLNRLQEDVKANEEVLEDEQVNDNNKVYSNNFKYNVDKDYFENNNKDKLLIYNDLDNNDKYTLDSIIQRLEITPTSGEMNIEGDTCYRFDDSELYKFNKDEVVNKEIHLGDKTRSDNPNRGLEKIVIYKNEENDMNYVLAHTVTRFDLDAIGSAIKIDGKICYPISKEDVDFIYKNRNNDYSPYIVEIRQIFLLKKGKKKREDDEILIDDIIEDKDKDKDKDDEVIVEKHLTLYIDVLDNNKLYAPVQVMQLFGIPFGDKGIDILGNLCVSINDVEEELIKSKASESINPKYIIDYVNVKLVKEKEKEVEKAKPHLQTILFKLTDGLSLSTKASKRFRSSNVKVSNVGRSILKGNWLYNVVSAIPGIVSMPFVALKKLVSNILLTDDEKKDIEELQRRLNELSEEELEVIFREYRGSQAKMDMNPQINDFIADRMRRYALDKVSEINKELENNYALFFTYLGQINSLEDRINAGNLSEEEFNALVEERKNLVEMAADIAINIDKSRKEGTEWLSGGGLHGFEEDMKAVSSKMSYVGYRFARSDKFDNETQALLAKFGQGFNDAVFANDVEGIVSNFINLEACYSANTEIKNSVFGKRSVGSKYYTPLAEEFDYRDDPFIRNLFSTIAITSAAVSAANSIYTHKISDERILAQHQKEVAQANGNLSQSQNLVNNINSHQADFRNGLEGQLRHTTDEVANGLERSAWDASNGGAGWTMDGNYFAADSANHVFYNNLHDSLSQRLSGVASQYGSGAIDQVKALEEMVKIANDSQTALNSVVNECLKNLQVYASKNPGIDIHAIEESLTYIASNPNAVIDMNNAILDISQQAGALSGLTPVQLTALSSLPNDMITTLLSAAGSCALATNVCNSMRNGYGVRRNSYGNQVTDMMDDYLHRQAESLMSVASENTR